MAPPPESVDSPAGAQRALDEGVSCLRQREWQRAHEAFEQAIDADPALPSAWEGLATAALCLDDAAGSCAAYERAYREYRERGDFAGAARAAVQLAVYYDAYRGESAIASGWFERARSLLEAVPPSAEHAWLAFWKAHLDIHIHGEVARGEPSLADAIRLSEACHLGGELELMTRGLRGLMAISAGAIDEGLRRLDDATATVTSEKLWAPQTRGWTYCYVLDACESVRDFDRAAQWIERAWQVEQEMAIQHYLGACRSHYVGILTWRGDYTAAEHQIEQMRREVGDVGPTFAAACNIRLGEVRRRQGRLDEAAALLEPLAAQLPAMLSLAALAVDRDEPQAAVELVERYLRRVSPGDCVRRLHGLELLVRANARRRDLDAARGALDECLAVVERSATPLMRAAVCDLRALMESAAGRPDQARCHFEDAIDGYDLTLAPYEAAAARLELGEVLTALGREDAARKVYEAALAAAGRLGAGRLAELAAEALRPHDAVMTAGQTPGPAVRRDGLTAREIEVLSFLAHGLSNQEIGERLCISAFTVKRHIANILTKLDLPSRTAAAAYAIRQGLVR